MSVVMLFDAFPAPSETFLAREVEALCARGLSIEVRALRPGPGVRALPGARWHRVLGERARWEAAGRALAREIEARRARGERVTHLHACWANHVADIARVAAQICGLTWSVFGHARDLRVEGGDLNARLGSAVWIGSCTRAGVHLLNEHGLEAHHAPHGLPLDQWAFRSWQPPAAGEPWRLLGVGRLVEKKGWLGLCEAISSTSRVAPGSGSGAFELRLIGEGPERARLEKAERAFGLAGWNGGPVLMGERDQSEVARAMNAAHVLVLPSRVGADGDADGLANVLLEAAAIGTPLLSTSAGAAGELVDATTGVLVPADDPAALAQALNFLREQPETTARRARLARERIERDFSIESTIEPLAKLFQRFT